MVLLKGGMTNITNGNDYKRGWEEGRQAALEGKDKDFIRMGISWKFVFHGNVALDSYIDGYNKGYESGINEKNVVRKVEITNNSINDMDYNNSQVQDLIRELQALKNLNDFLVIHYCDRIRQVNGLFRGFITMLADTGIPVQECKEFADKYYVADETNFKALFERVTNYDIPQILAYIEQIRRQYIAATGSDFGQINLKSPSNSIPSTVPRGAKDRKGGPQDYEKQYDAVCDLMDFLVEQRDELQQTIREYERYCQEMINSGVPRQIVEHYVPNYAQPNVSIINRTTSHIQDSDYPQLRKLQVEIATSLGELGKSVNRSPKNM